MMQLKAAGSEHIIDVLDQALIALISSISMPAVYKAGDWNIKVTSADGYSTAVLSASEFIADKLHACLTAYEADTGMYEYKRVFRNEFNDLWVCECINES